MNHKSHKRNQRRNILKKKYSECRRQTNEAIEILTMDIKLPQYERRTEVGKVWENSIGVHCPIHGQHIIAHQFIHNPYGCSMDVWFHDGQRSYTYY